MNLRRLQKFYQIPEFRRNFMEVIYVVRFYLTILYSPKVRPFFFAPIHVFCHLKDKKHEAVKRKAGDLQREFPFRDPFSCLLVLTSPFFLSSLNYTARRKNWFMENFDENTN